MPLIPIGTEAICCRGEIHQNSRSLFAGTEAVNVNWHITAPAEELEQIRSTVDTAAVLNCAEPSPTDCTYPGVYHYFHSATQSVNASPLFRRPAQISAGGR